MWSLRLFATLERHPALPGRPPPCSPTSTKTLNQSRLLASSLHPTTYRTEHLGPRNAPRPARLLMPLHLLSRTYAISSNHARPVLCRLLPSTRLMVAPAGGTLVAQNHSSPL